MNSKLIKKDEPNYSQRLSRQSELEEIKYRNFVLQQQLEQEKGLFLIQNSAYLH